MPAEPDPIRKAAEACLAELRMDAERLVSDDTYHGSRLGIIERHMRALVEDVAKNKISDQWKEWFKVDAD